MFALHKGFESEIMPVVRPHDMPLRAAMMGEGRRARVPGGVGLMILGVYALVMAALLVLFARDTEAGLMVAISRAYFTVYLAVPAMFFRTEGRSGDIDLRRGQCSSIQDLTSRRDGRPPGNRGRILSATVVRRGIAPS